MTRDDAVRIAQEFLDRTYRRDRGHPAVAIAESATVEKPYGWLFVYDTAEALRTGGPGLTGNGPLLVRREDGKIVEFSSFYTSESALDAYEEDPGRFRVVGD
ncbi:YrhB domain-containing protein [Actinoallomurus iriomotensis]|uniref:Immunity protein 35 domain-containing protein n=1 Tax=Actinoallomurus iriomotensis TaxID=478107 RepID=A0A9W6S4G1_9ACTN|nr:YrhB domain-containing protein [Actinoallomurus iriomotensis]GLY85572.1 hypothetical protein Airi02_035010 [Actinoallomurus iriomotensis]